MLTNRALEGSQGRPFHRPIEPHTHLGMAAAEDVKCLSLEGTNHEPFFPYPVPAGAETPAIALSNSGLAGGRARLDTSSSSRPRDEARA